MVGLIGLAASLFISAQPAAAAAHITIAGAGVNSGLTCATITTAPAEIAFNATKGKSAISGFGQVITNYTTLPRTSYGFTFIGGTLNARSFSLIGYIYSDRCGTTSNLLPSRMVLTGTCGIGVVIHYVDSTGETGDFTGNVICP